MPTYLRLAGIHFLLIKLMKMLYLEKRVLPTIEIDTMNILITKRIHYKQKFKKTYI